MKNRVIELDQTGLEQLAADIARKARPGDRFFLSGPLGSGKSTFARAFIRALGIQGAIPSPTFIMDSVYSTVSPVLEIHHMDLYRLFGTEEELVLLGFDQILESEAVVLVEWPERIPFLESLRGCRIELSSGRGPDTRSVRVDRILAGN